MKRYDQLVTLINQTKPKKIVEVGTHKGKTAELMCREALKHWPDVQYTGYDLFEDATAENNAAEMNGKAPAALSEAEARLEKIKEEFPNFSYELVKGNTKVTLHGLTVIADLAFIDGGHSVETIAGDFEALRQSRLIVFDDFYAGGVDTTKFGCNSILLRVPHEIMPAEDNVKGVKIRFAVVGYSTKWRKAIERVCKDEGIKTVSIWRGERVKQAQLMCALNTLENIINVDESLDQIRKLSTKRFFFVIKADHLRSLLWWRSKLEEYFQLTEWFAQGDEVVGVGMPLFVVNEWASRGAWSDDKRWGNIVSNVKTVTRRIMQLSEPHGRRAILVCYGPSLAETWPNIKTEEKFLGGDIISVSGSHDFLLRRDIVPKFHVECDPRPHKAKHISKARYGVKYLMASCCHPDTIDVVKDADTYLWHMCNGPESYRITEELEPESFLVMGGGNVGLRAVALFYGALGYREFSIHGMDCSFTEDERQHAGRHSGKKQAVINVRCGDEWFKTSPVLVTYARHFFDTMQRAEGATFTLHGHGLLQSMCKLMNAEKAKEAA